MGGEDHPLLLGCLCLKMGRDESAAPRAHSYNPLLCCPQGQPSRRRAKGGSPAASTALSTVGLSPVLPHCCVHPFSHHPQTPSPPHSCTATAMTPWQTQSSYSRWFLSTRRLNSGLKSQMLSEEELLWKGAGRECQGTPCCSSSQPPFHSPKLGALLRAPLFLHTGAVVGCPAPCLQLYL